MRKINEIIVHCAETRADQMISAADINQWHKKRNWKCIGYHFFIKRDGTIEKGRDISEEGAHCYGHNRHSIGICYAGGIAYHGDEKVYVDNRTPEQIRAMFYLIQILMMTIPSIKKVVGHNKYANVACPCFDAEAEYSNLVQVVGLINKVGW